MQLVRSIQPTGAIHMAGYSFGAVVAFELALQLEVSFRDPGKQFGLSSCAKDIAYYIVRVQMPALSPC